MPANLPYPLQFDPSQMKDLYSRWAGAALPFSSAEVGSSGLYGGTAPTTAMGQPIQSYTDANAAAQSGYQQQQADYQKALAAYNASQPQGTQINNTGGSANNDAMIQFLQNQDLNIQSFPQGNQGGFGSGNSGPLSGGQRDQIVNNAMQISQLQKGGAVPGPALPAPPQAPQQPNMTQAYLAALQSPGHVTTPGATVPQAAPPSQQSNVLQQFLANWQKGGSNTSGAGNYDNRGFFGGLVGNV